MIIPYIFPTPLHNWTSLGFQVSVTYLDILFILIWCKDSHQLWHPMLPAFCPDDQCVFLSSKTVSFALLPLFMCVKALKLWLFCAALWQPWADPVKLAHSHPWLREWRAPKLLPSCCCISQRTFNTTLLSFYSVGARNGEFLDSELTRKSRISTIRAICFIIPATKHVQI